MIYSGYCDTQRWIQMVLVASVISIYTVYINVKNGRFSVPEQLPYGSIISNNLRNYSTLPDTCKCRSMFTIGACGMSQVTSLNPYDSVWVKAIEGLERARIKQDILMMPHLKTLARYIPPLFRFNVTPATGTLSPNLSAERYLSRTTHRLPYFSCAVHVYSPKEVRECTRQHLTNTGQPIRIAFVGDSLVRNTMQQMIRSTFHAIQYRLAGESEGIEISLKFLDHKLKVNLPVEGEGIELRLHWSPFLEKNREPEEVSQQGARDLLEAWASGNPGPEDGPLPDVIYMTTGLWDAHMLPEDLAVESFVRILELMGPLLKKLAEKTRVIWHIHEPHKEWLAIRDIPNGALDMMNRVSWKWLGDSNIWLWDTHTVLTLRGHAECRRYYQANLHKLVPLEWGCTDFVHAGRDVEDAAGNMLWNLVCNSAKGMTPDHCCT